MIKYFSKAQASQNNIPVVPNVADVPKVVAKLVNVPQVAKVVGVGKVAKYEDDYDDSDSDSDSDEA